MTRASDSGADPRPGPAMAGWTPAILKPGLPRYLAIADAIAEEMKSGRLAPGDRLPPQRLLARQLDLDFTTVARGYNEAQRRGLVESRVGNGTFVRGTVLPAPAARSRIRADLSMNLPPDITDPQLLDRMQQGLAAVGDSLVDLLRYQEFGGSDDDRQAGIAWLVRRGVAAIPDRLLVCPGAHSALLAVLGSVAAAGEVIAAEALTYPGVRAIAAQLRLDLVGLDTDGDGILPDAFAALCRSGRPPRALYCNPVLQNPTTTTIPRDRRLALIAIARHYGVPIIEDDAYGLLPKAPPPAFAALAPDLTYHISGLAKYLGAGLRLAYLLVPDARRTWPLATSLRAATVMASPLTAALATRWIAEGTADAMLQAVRAESLARYRLAADILPAGSFAGSPEGFHLWLTLPAPWTRSNFAATVRSSSIGIVVSDAFAATENPPEAVRVGLGGAIDREELGHALELLAHALRHSPAMVSRFI